MDQITTTITQVVVLAVALTGLSKNIKTLSDRILAIVGKLKRQTLLFAVFAHQGDDILQVILALG